MLQEQKYVAPLTIRRDAGLQAFRQRLPSSMLGGAIFTGVSIVLGALVVWLFNPLRLLGDPLQRLFAVGALPFHAPLLFLLFLLIWLLATAAIFLVSRPLALRSYLRDVHNAQASIQTSSMALRAPVTLVRAEQPGKQVELMEQRQEQTPLEVLQQSDTHLLLLAEPGSGKTTAFYLYEYELSQRPLQQAFSQQRIPVYLPLKNYSLYVKKHVPHVDVSEQGQVTLFDFLAESDQDGLRSLRAYWQLLARQGRLLLLCDGLNEVDEGYIPYVIEELIDLMRATKNRVILTAREVDYAEYEELQRLVAEGIMLRAVVAPLEPEQVHELVERYVEGQDRHWQHTAGQIMQVIERSRLRYHCSNPMLAFTLMAVIDTLGVERGRLTDTRGRLLREYVRQVIEQEQRQPSWQQAAPQEREVIRFLSELACAARWMGERMAIQLRVSTKAVAATSAKVAVLDFAELADDVRYWLDEHPAQGPFETEGYAALPFEPFDNLAQLIEFAQSAALIEISHTGIISFRHELLADYFVAEHFYATDSLKRTVSLPFREELLEQVAYWALPMALWVGLADDPLELAARLGGFAESQEAYRTHYLSLALLCLGVAWQPPQADNAKTLPLPEEIQRALARVLSDPEASEELRQLFTLCAQQGGQEIYHSLLPLIMFEGSESFFQLLDQPTVLPLLFAYLREAVDHVGFEAQIKRLTRVLGSFDGVVVPQAARLSLPAPERSLRLRAAAINILGGTHAGEAVEPLIGRLSDAEVVIVERATNALIRLGPRLTLKRSIEVLEDHQPHPFLLRIHCAALTVLGRFMEELDGREQISSEQFLRVLAAIVPVLSVRYQSEPEAQQLARELLVRQGRSSEGRGERTQQVIEALMRNLSSQSEVALRNVTKVLQEIGAPATPALLEVLDQADEGVRVRIIEILQNVRDTRALPQLLKLMQSPSPALQPLVAQTLQVYAPESIPGLLNLVLTAPDELVAERAAAVLMALGEQALEPVTQALQQVVPVRTRLLVHILEQTKHPSALPALMRLLETPDIEPLLAISLVRALSQFADARVVSPLLGVLSSSHPQLYEEAVDALSQLGVLALSQLLVALDVPEENLLTARVRRAILGMTPFPAEALVLAFGTASERLAWQIREILKAQGAESAQALVNHAQDKDVYVREHVLLTLNEMPGTLIVPALLEVLNQPVLRRTVNSILLKHPEVAIPPLVNLLADADRGDVAAALLPQFGPDILRPLLIGLDEQRAGARERAQRIVVALVRQSERPEDVLHEVLQLFHPAPPPRAYESLIAVLSNELADVSLPLLLDGMSDAHLIDPLSEIFVRLARKASLFTTVLETLLYALYVEEHRRGAATALVKIGAPVVARVGELITDSEPVVAKTAREILREIGVPALTFIWSAQSDSANPYRREAALDVFHKMRTETIKDELVSLLVSDKPDAIAMAVTLLLERIHDEAIQHYADRMMVAELVEYVQTHEVDDTNLRVIALLLLLGERTIVEHLIQNLDEYPQHRRQLLYAFLLLGQETQDALQELFSDQNISSELRAELASILGMMSAPQSVINYAENIGEYGITPKRSEILYPEQLTIAHRALGGLLAGGYWNIQSLQALRDEYEEGSFLYELASLLLGWRYSAQVKKLENDLDEEREAHKGQVLKLSTRIIEDQKRVRTLEEELEELRQQHGARDEDMERFNQEMDEMRDELEQVSVERDRLRAQLQRAVGDIKYLREQIYDLGGEPPERRTRPTTRP